MPEKLQPYLDRLNRLSIATKLLLVTAIVMIGLTIVIDLVVVRQVRTTLEAQLTSEVTSANRFLKFLTDQKGSAALRDGKLEFGGWAAASNFTLVDQTRDLTGSEATMFQLKDGEFVRLATTLKQADGTRAVDTTLQGEAASALRAGRDYSGTNVILGQAYITSYVLVLDTAGRPVGALFAGTSTGPIGQQQARIATTVALTSLVILLASLGLIFVFVSRVVTRPMKELATAAERITTGDYAVRMPIANDDELGEVARTVNTMIERVTDNARLQEAQNAAMQTQIVRLLEEVSSVAEGDLTVEAEVSAGALGAVADSFNYMIAELRQIVGRVNGATQQVGRSTDEILATTDVLNRAAQQQAARIADTSTAVEEMAVSIQQVSENAAVSARVAREARATAADGAGAVAATVAGMGRIRDRVQETARTIEQLGASSQEIGAVVSLIREVADQTELLALNAAIEAALVGEQGRGFAVVAEEVRRLAERVTVASAQIDTLVQGVQGEAIAAMAAMAEGTREVVAGAELADEAGRALARLDATAAQLAGLIESISLAADQQARASVGIARSMTEVSSLTTDTTAGTQQAAASVAALATLADDLRDSVAAFRLGDERATVAQGGPRRGDVPPPPTNDVVEVVGRVARLQESIVGR